jgi:hypothetical protein
VKILFIGNSFTARNDLPGMIATLAVASGTRIDHELISAGGASLRQHWNKGDAQRAIARGKFDFVVLQEQSTLPIKNAARFLESVRLFDPVIRESDAKTCLYMTWARAHAPKSQCALTDAYTQIAEDLDATLVPVGVVWEKFLAKHKHPILHDADGSHPALAGSYLAACVFVATLWSRQVLKAAKPVLGVRDEDAKLIREFVMKVKR